MAVGLFINIGFFLSANLGIGASVIFDGQILLEHIKSPSLMNFGLIDSITNMWKAQVYPLAILIACLSGAFP